MCKYYAHTHPCGHTRTVFAAFCPTSALVQRPCGGGEIWTTVKMEGDCERCAAAEEQKKAAPAAEPPPSPALSRNTSRGIAARKAGGRR